MEMRYLEHLFLIMLCILAEGSERIFLLLKKIGPKNDESPLLNIYIYMYI